jgi:ankyrin repeat protein
MFEYHDARERQHCLHAGETPLYAACSSGHLEVVGALLAKGADVQATNNVSIERACALCPSRSLAYMQNAHCYL